MWLAMLGGLDDGPIHPLVVRATRPTIQQNRIRRSCTEVCSASSTCRPTRPTLATSRTHLPFCHSSRAFFLTALTAPHHSFSRLLLQLLRSTSCKESSKLQYSVACSRVRATVNYAAILTRQLKIGSRDNVECRAD